MDDRQDWGDRPGSLSDRHDTQKYANISKHETTMEMDDKGSHLTMLAVSRAISIRSMNTCLIKRAFLFDEEK
jgi:hypothetical protein